MEAFNLDLIIQQSVTEYRRQEKENTNMNALLKGLLAAMAGGAVMGATHALTADKITLKGTGSAAAMGALSVLAAYLTQSPVTPVPQPDAKP